MRCAMVRTGASADGVGLDDHRFEEWVIRSPHHGWRDGVHYSRSDHMFHRSPRLATLLHGMDQRRYGWRHCTHNYTSERAGRGVAV